MQTLAQTPSGEPNTHIPKEVIEAYHKGYTYYYQFQLNNKREEELYTRGIAILKDQGVDHRVFLIDSVAHVVLRLSLTETIENINRRVGGALDDEAS